jgi:glycosidase
MKRRIGFLWLLGSSFAPLFAAEVENGLTLKRVEPPHWWVGMRESKLQLLCQGDQIGALEVHLADERVVSFTVKRVANPNYLFLDLELRSDAEAGPLQLEFFDPAGDPVGEYLYSLRARRPGAAEIDGFDSSDVIYLITPDRFANGDPENDTVAGYDDPVDRSAPQGRHGGDLAGVRQALPYLEDLGVTQLWLNPVLENAMPEASYHGYAITDYYVVDPRFGSLADYRALANEAHERGIGLIMDVVVNHCGSEHWWMRDLPTPDWINDIEAPQFSNHWRTTLKDPHAAAIDRRIFSDGWFVPTMPDLNQRQPLLGTYLYQNTIWWIEELGLSGIRIDTYPYPDRDYMAEWCQRIRTEYPGINLVGEEWSLAPAIVASWQDGKNNPDGYDSNLPSLMDFPLQDALVKALTTPDRPYWSSWTPLYETLAMDFLYPDPTSLVIFPDNHDMDRFFTQLGGDMDLFRLGMTYLLTTRGVPQIYYGTEILMENNGFPRDHGIIRTDFPGGWPGDAVNAFTGEGLSEDQRTALMFTRQLLQWRKESQVVHQGRLVHFAPEDGVYVYFRLFNNAAVMVILNKADESRTLDLTRFGECLRGAGEARNVLTGEAIRLETSLVVPPRSPLLFEVR